MATQKKIIAQDLELADEEIARLRKENKKLKEKIKQMEKYQQNNWIKLKKVQGENYKLKKDIEMIKKAFPMLFDEGPQIGEPYGKSMVDILKEKGIDVSCMEDDTIQELIDIGEIEY